MATLTVLALFGFVAIPAIGWAIRLTCRIVGWTLRMALGIFLAPLWIVILLAGGLAVAARALLPLVIVWYLVSMIFAED